VQPVGKRAAMQSFHDKCADAHVDVVVNPHQVGVVERGQQPSLGREALASISVLEPMARQQLDRDIAVQPHVRGGVYRSERTASKKSVDRVRRKRRRQRRALVRFDAKSFR
jgi:hypothetical protein